MGSYGDSNTRGGDGGSAHPDAVHGPHRNTNRNVSEAVSGAPDEPAGGAQGQLSPGRATVRQFMQAWEKASGGVDCELKGGRTVQDRFVLSVQNMSGGQFSMEES